jgi:hypothetical protein
MRRTRTTLAALGAALALTAGVASAQATLPDRKTYVTVSGPVSVPGMTLPAGTYTFRIADSLNDRHIVQIFNREGTQLFTTLIAIPAQRPEAEGDAVVTFKETPSDRPPAIHYWFYAGERDGNELVYPRSQALQIAQASGEPVMSVDGETTDGLKSGSMSRVTAAEAQPAQPPTAAATDTAPAQPQQPPTTAPPTTTADPAPATPAATPASPSVPPPAASDNERPVGTSGNLPRTASELPIVGLIGVLALALALAVRAVRTA